MEICSECNRYKFLKFLHKEGFPASVKCIESASRNGFIKIVKFLHQNTTLASSITTTTAFDRACKNGYLDVVMYLDRNGYMYSKKAFKWASRRGHFSIIKYLVENKEEFQKLHLSAIEYSAENGYFEILKYLLEIANTKTLWNTLMVKLKKLCTTNIEILRFLYRNGYKIDPGIMECILIYSATNGDLPVVKFVHNLGETQSIISPDNTWLDNVCMNGHLEVLKFIIKNRTEVLSSAGVTFACVGGHLEMVKWIHQNYSTFRPILGVSSLFTDLCFEESAINGQIEVLKFLFDNYSYHNEDSLGKSFIKACYQNHLPIVRFLLNNTNAKIDMVTYLNWNKIYRKGWLELLKTLIFSKIPTDQEKISVGGDGLDECSVYGHLEMIKILHQYTTAPCTFSSLNSAAKNGYFEIVEFLCNHRSSDCYIFTAIQFARKYGHTHIVDYLNQFMTDQ
eukprot:gene5696-7087_t